MNPVVRFLLAGLAAGFAMNIALAATFGPAQGILGDPSLQHAKFIAAFTEEPLPRAVAFPALLPLGLLALGFAHALAFQLLYRGLPQNWFRAGVTYGFAAWLIAYLWFEFYLPWNVMLEPAPLVALELACWLVVMLANGLAIAFVYRRALKANAARG